MDITKLKPMVDLCAGVLKDARVIATALLTIFFILLANYVVDYRKKPPRIKTKRIKVAAAAPAAQDEAKPDEKSASGKKS